MTPVITSISPNSESALNSLLTISGTGFSSSMSRLLDLKKKLEKLPFYFFKGDVQVTIGGSVCTITSSSDTQIVCTLGINSAGEYPVSVLINSKGLAANTTRFTYNLIVSSLSNSQGKNQKFYFQKSDLN